MANKLHLPGLDSLPLAPIAEFARLGYVQDRELFSHQLVGPDLPIVEPQDMIDDFDPTRTGLPVLDEVPPQAEEAVGLMLDDMHSTFKRGSYVLRVLFRQGDVTHSLDPDFDLAHCDLEGNCLATYIVSDQSPTIARVKGGKATGNPYQIIRMRGDVPHYRPPKVSNTRTTVIANITDRRSFDVIKGGSLANLARISGILKPVRYPKSSS